MTTHFSILPSEIIRYLTFSLDNKVDTATEKPHRLLRLPHPRTGSPALFLPLEWLPPSLHENSIQSTLLEIQAVSPPDERSWILGEEITSNGNLLIMTPIDPTFLLLYILQATHSNNPNSTQFRTADDLFDESVRQMAATNKSQNSASSVVEGQDILEFCSLICTRKSLTNLCDVKEISSEIIVYHFSTKKTLDYMRAKVSHLEKCTAIDGSRTVVRSLARDGLMEDGKEELLQLGRTRACCDLIAQYLTPYMRDTLVDSYNFGKLKKYLDANTQEVIAMTSAPSKAKKAGSKETAAGTTAVKRKPVKASRGIENLKKVNTTGMAKMSSFFSKA